MSGLSDTLTVGLVLLLLFGSACLYLYTRIQQVEAKLNLVESILLDLKMTNELKAYPPVPAPAQVKPRSREQSIGDVAHPMSHGMEEVAPSEIQPFQDADDEEEFLNHTLGPRRPEEEHDDTGTGHVPSLASGAPAPVAPVQHTESVKQTASYESMTAKELQALAKQRNIPGTSGMRRAQLIEMLKQSDERTSSHVGIFESLAASALVESAEEIHSLDA
jgi:hypothetical protein